MTDVVHVQPQDPVVISISSTTNQPAPSTPIVIAPGQGGSRGPQGIQGIQGFQGVQGVQGPPGPTLAYTHTQNAPATEWEIHHNLGIYPQVSVVEFGGANVVGDVTYVDMNTIRVTFGALISGYAYIS